MAETVIQVEKLGKYYRINRRRQQATSTSAKFYNLLTAPFEYIKSVWSEPSEEETLWALRNVSFVVQEGDILGIIGRNGAGKSTLLKILSRITEPTEGRAILRGRIGSLLEVGTGFHPELTGRENVYMSGAILGMTRQEIQRKFDEIVAFAEVEQFIDTPVKRYSSGMYVRLAFAVAAYLDADILLVDEVLAVGDVAFQKKCLNIMTNIGRAGRTVLFVSHNMSAIQSLCNRVLWLNEGQLIADGFPDEVIANYLKTSVSSLRERVWDNPATAPGNNFVRLHRVSVHPASGSVSGVITMATPLVVTFEYWNLTPDIYLNLNIQLITEEGIVAFVSTSVNEPVWHGRPFKQGLFRSRCYIPGNLLNSGFYVIKLRFVQNEHYIIFEADEILAFNVQDAPERRRGWYGKMIGAVQPLLEWTTELVQQEVVEEPDHNVTKSGGQTSI